LVMVVAVAVAVVVVVELGMVVVGTGERGVNTRHLHYEYSRFEKIPKLTAKVESRLIFMKDDEYNGDFY